MLAYWLLFFAPVLPLLLSSRRTWSVPFTLPIIFLLSIFIGLRYQVGGDWYSYYFQFLGASQTDFSTLGFTDIGYQLLNILFSASIDGYIWVNFFCALIFSSGLLFFCRKQPLPWLAFLLSIPYLVTVVSLGYTRQSVAIGFLMLGFTYLQERRLTPFILLLLAGSLFHTTVLFMAILCLPLFRTNNPFQRLFQLALVSISIYAIGQAFFASRVERLFLGYIVNEYSSQGAYIRCALNFLPSILVLLFPKSLHLTYSERTIWKTVSILSLLCTLLLFLFPSNSTAIDRIALYFIPVQLAILSRVPYLFARPHTYIILLLIAINALILFVWLNFANNAFAWLPYQNVLF